MILSVLAAREPATQAPADGEGTTGPETLRVAAASLTPEAAGPEPVAVPFAERPAGRLPIPGVPPGWALQTFAGEAGIELVRDEGRLALRLRSRRASFALYRDVVVDLAVHPVLAWSWKAVQLPQAGDGRELARDDQAVQVYVVFPRWPDPLTASDVVGYVWDTRAGAGTRLTSPRAPNVRTLVVDSGAERLGRWLARTRNVADDYRALFGREPPRVGAVAVMTDSDDTRGSTEALVADLRFTRATQ